MRIQHCAMEAPRLALASPEGVFVAVTVAEVSGFPAVVSLGSPNCTPPGKTNSSTWNASQWIHETPRIPPTSRQDCLTRTMGAKVVTYWHERSAWAFRQVWGWIIENREQFREIVLKKCRFNEQIAKLALFSTICRSISLNILNISRTRNWITY